MRTSTFIIDLFFYLPQQMRPKTKKQVNRATTAMQSI